MNRRLSLFWGILVSTLITFSLTEDSLTTRLQTVKQSPHVMKTTDFSTHKSDEGMDKNTALNLPSCLVSEYNISFSECNVTKNEKKVRATSLRPKPDKSCIINDLDDIASIKTAFVQCECLKKDFLRLPLSANKDDVWTNTTVVARPEANCLATNAIRDAHSSASFPLLNDTAIFSHWERPFKFKCESIEISSISVSCESLPCVDNERPEAGPFEDYEYKNCSNYEPDSSWSVSSKGAIVKASRIAGRRSLTIKLNSRFKDVLAIIPITYQGSLQNHDRLSIKLNKFEQFDWIIRANAQSFPENVVIELHEGANELSIDYIVPFSFHPRNFSSDMDLVLHSMLFVQSSSLLHSFSLKGLDPGEKCLFTVAKSLGLFSGSILLLVVMLAWSGRIRLFKNLIQGLLRRAAKAPL